MRKTIGVLGQYGWIPDQQPQELPENAFSDVLDVRFKDGELQSMVGETRVFPSPPSVTPYFILPFTTSAKKYWAYLGLARAFVNDGTTETDITPASPFTGTASNKWTGGTVNGYPVFNNGIESPVYWDLNTANDLVTLTGWDATERAAAVRTFKDFIFAMGITKGATVLPNLFKWSDRAPVGGIPTSWDETDVTKDAGEQPLTGNDGIMVDGLQLGDSFIIYYERAMYVVRESFNSAIFTFQRLPGVDGMLAIGCVADTPIGHVVLTAGDVIVHQGQGSKSLADARVKNWINTSMDSTNRKQSFVVHNPRFKEVWVCIPTVGNSVPNRAAVYSYAYDNWTLRELPSVNHAACGLIDYSSVATWASAADPWDLTLGTWDGSPFPPGETVLLLATATPAIDMADVGAYMGGTTSFTPYARRAGLAIEEPWRFKFFSALTPRFDSTVSNTVQISLGSQIVAERGESYGAVITYTVGTMEPEACGISQSGRFLAYEIRSLTPLPWSMKSMDIEYRKQGVH